MIERNHPKLSVAAQCRLLSISRSSFHCQPQRETEKNLARILLIDKQFLETPCYGVRQMTWPLQNEQHAVNETPVRRLMRLMRVRRENSVPHRSPTRLTADLPEARHQHARAGAQDLPLSAGWAADPAARSAQVAPTSLASRCNVASCIWSPSWTGSRARCWPGASPTSSHSPPLVRGPWRGEADVCVEALNEAIHRFGAPDIMNSDQGSQFTSFVWTDRLKCCPRRRML